MTPQEFKERMEHIATVGDIEEGHAEADRLMCELLRELGYKDGVVVYDAMNKWYA